MSRCVMANVVASLHVWDYVVVGVYLVVVLAIGWYCSREQEQSEDYFVAGRQMPWLAVGLSIVATMLSTVTYLATPGEVIQHGLALSIGWTAIPLAFVIVNFLWIPFFMRLGVTSVLNIVLVARRGGGPWPCLSSSCGCCGWPRSCSPHRVRWLR